MALVLLLPLLLLANGALARFQRRSALLSGQASFGEIRHGLLQFLSERRLAPGESWDLGWERSGGTVRFWENPPAGAERLTVSHYRENVLRCDLFFGDSFRSFLVPLDLPEILPAEGTVH